MIMINYCSLQEINPCGRSVGMDAPVDQIGPERMIYDHEMVYCHRGAFTVYYDGRIVTANAGEVLIIPPKVPHRLNYSQSIEVYWVHLDFFYHKDQDLLARYIAFDKEKALSPEGYTLDYARPQLVIKPHHSLPMIYPVQDKKNTRSTFLELIDLFDKKPYNWIQLTKGYMNHLLAETLMYLEPMKSSGTASTLISDATKDYLLENPHRKVTVDELANRFHYHPDTLRRLFKKETGLTLKSYETDLLLNKIRQLLADTDMSLEQIAETLQMTDRSHLIKFFKSKTGLTPGDYRHKQ